MPIVLQAKALKTTLVLDPAALLAASAIIQGAVGRVEIRIEAGGRTVTGDIAAKALRKALAAITEAGPDGVALVLQGRLEAGDVLAEAGLTAQPKTPKPAAVAA